jgi:riboflavin kinase
MEKDGNMKPYLLQMLKELALLGATRNRIEISSLDLANHLYTSQQTASRYLLELEKEEMITREMGIKKQLIQITNIGKDILQEEYLLYQQIFELANRVYLTGKIVSGMGEGRYYTEQNGYGNQFKDKLGFKPYPGTLNVEIKHIERNKIRFLKKYNAIIINEFETNNRTFGGVRCFHSTIENTDCAIVLPSRSHYSNILEFISHHFLREKLDLKDGDEVKIVIYLEK